MEQVKKNTMKADSGKQEVWQFMEPSQQGLTDQATGTQSSWHRLYFLGHFNDVGKPKMGTQ